MRLFHSADAQWIQTSRRLDCVAIAIAVVMELFADRCEIQALRDENKWLLQRLDASERICKRLERIVTQQARRIEHIETTAVDTERAWRQRLEQREKEWMHEYNAQMEALLRIIQHHESARAALEEQPQRSASRVEVLQVSSATQTEPWDNSIVEQEQQELEEPQRSSIASDPALECDACRCACSPPPQQPKQRAEMCSEPPAAFQVRVALCECHEVTPQHVLTLTSCS